jgi:PAS domain S-box-containing protein
MIRIENKRRVSREKTLSLVIIMPLLLLCVNAFGSDDSTSVTSAAIYLTRTYRFILISLALISTVCAVIIYFTLKLRKVNRELNEKNKQVLDVNEDLKRTNNELARQKELMWQALNESEKFYGMLLQSADDGISFYDSSWKLKYANSAFYSMIGVSKDDYTIKNTEEFVHPDDRGYHERRIRSLNNEGFFESELKLRHSDGRFIILSTKSVVVKNDNGEVLGSLTISRDITKMKQAHDDLLKANEEAKASNRLKTSFLANISHEIRTPLNSVVGFSNLLLADDITKEVREEYIEHINFNSEKLLQIIGDIIDLSRLESSQIEIRYEETSLNSMIDEIMQDTRKIIRRNDKPILLNVRNHFANSGDLIFTDRVWLKRVLNHLMDNAVKFTLDGTIDFICTVENNNIAFRIKDTGIGINKENLVRIFEEFRQEIDGHHRPFEGLGVGLTLAKEVVERMGGKITVQSEKGIGSLFCFTLPYRPAGTNKLKEYGDDSFVPEPEWSSRKCLLVDDNNDVLIYLRRILADTGINILTARSGYEAIQVVKFTPDINLVLLDMQMPEMNGMEVTRELRMLRKDLPIIAQTAFIFEDDKDIIIEAGCDACLIKPIRKEHLLSLMTGFLK